MKANPKKDVFQTVRAASEQGRRLFHYPNLYVRLPRPSATTPIRTILLTKILFSLK